jgi:hypothetical protein
MSALLARECAEEKNDPHPNYHAKQDSTQVVDALADEIDLG